MEMIAMLGGLGQRPGPLVLPGNIYTGMEGLRAPMLAALGAEDKKEDEAWYQTTPGMIGIGLAVAGLLWHLSRRGRGGDEEDDRDYDSMMEEMRAQEAMERGLPIRTDGLGRSPRRGGRKPRRGGKMHGLGAMKKVEAIKKGMIVGFPGDKKVRTQWATVDRVEKGKNTITFHSRDLASEFAKKMDPDATGVYFARKGESLKVKE